ncbi:hypothetical protein HPP92_004442 [Vanilla planifolia]|uniref:Uncharacterized protein n=1 Tax=Vanilla planifolia TaxID=51239 RepID=A0A835VKC1_VANPL|nr:hypothetical protein HPP92_004442 [Vanilla planifolia]
MGTETVFMLVFSHCKKEMRCHLIQFSCFCPRIDEVILLSSTLKASCAPTIATMCRKMETRSDMPKLVLLFSFICLIIQTYHRKGYLSSKLPCTILKILFVYKVCLVVFFYQLKMLRVL